MQPGTFFTKFVKAKNRIAVEITSEMSTILVLKNSLGQDKTKVYANFTTSDFLEKSDINFTYELFSNQTSLFFENDEIITSCEMILKDTQSSHCYLVLEIVGTIGELFSIGYTFNSLPFHLYEDSSLIVPVPIRVDASLNFVYHINDNKKAHLQFNSFNEHARVFTKLIEKAEFENNSNLVFPNVSNYDETSQQFFGSITEVIYDKKTVENLNSEGMVLISIRSNFPKSSR